MTQTPDMVALIEDLFEAARRKDMITVQVRVGEDLRRAFEDQAGGLFDNGVYKGVPISFDAIDPSAVLAETEPA